MQYSHYVLIVAGALAGALPTTAQAFPAAWRPVFLSVAAMCALIAVVAGAVSDKLTTKANVVRESLPPPEVKS
jgi:xanthine/uracil permease